MDDGPGFARPGACQHQQVPLLRGCHNGLLYLIAKALNNICISFGRHGRGDDFFLAGKVPADEFIVGVLKIVPDKVQGGPDFLHAELGIFFHDMHLDIFLFIVLGQGLVIPPGVLPGQGSFFHGQGKCLAEYPQTVLKGDHLCVVEKQQAFFHQPAAVSLEPGQKNVLGHGLDDVREEKLSQNLFLGDFKIRIKIVDDGVNTDPGTPVAQRHALL